MATQSTFIEEFEPGPSTGKTIYVQAGHGPGITISFDGPDSDYRQQLTVEEAKQLRELLDQAIDFKTVN